MASTHVARRDAPSGWLRLLPEPPPARPLRGDHVADAVVVGAGFTGLAAARRLAELRPGSRVVLLEADRVGAGPSGRNSGFVIDQPHNVDALDVEDLAANRRVKRLAQAGLGELKALVERHGISCGWSEAGKLHAAVGPRGEAELGALSRGLEKLGEPHHRLDGEQLGEIVGTRYYSAGLFTPGCVLVQPAALVRGLAEVLPDGVELHEDSPVAQLESSDGGWRIQTPAGSVHAPRVVLATDAYTRRLGLLRDRLVPIYTYASLTRPLGPTEVGGRTGWGLLPAHKAGTTLRRLDDGRLLVRNSFRYGGDFRCTGAHLERARRRHLAALTARYPALRPDDVQFTWGGVVCFTRNFSPFFGEVERGLHAAVGTNGVGLSKGTIAGRLVAELALGERSALLDDLLAFPPPARVPPYPFLGMGVRARIAWEEHAAGDER
ncbi:MAG TPA: FAD-binding oxidoreductase [Anaeromyxobacteraceae bacterium]